MSSMNIIGHFKELRLFEKDGKYWVVDGPNKKVLYKGQEESAYKLFTVLVLEFIDEKFSND